MKIKNIWKENKITVLFIGVVLLIIIIFFLMVFPLYTTRSGSNYGNRLDGIKKVAISDDLNNNIKKFFKDNDKIDKVNVKLKGRLYNIVINTKDGVDINEIVNITPDALTNFDEKQLKYYDIQIFITSNMNEESKTVVGYKSKNSESIIWTNNK